MPNLFSNKTDMAIRLFTALRLEEQSLRLTIQEAATALATAYKVLVGYANFLQNGAVLLSWPVKNVGKDGCEMCFEGVVISLGCCTSVLDISHYFEWSDIFTL
jgi:hypothetical protein